MERESCQMQCFHQHPKALKKDMGVFFKYNCLKPTVLRKILQISSASVSYNQRKCCFSGN